MPLKTKKGRTSKLLNNNMRIYMLGVSLEDENVKQILKIEREKRTG